MQRRRLWLPGFLAFGALVGLAEAQETAASDAPAPVELKTLRAQLDEALQAFYAAYGEAETDEAKSKVYEKLYPDQSTYARRAWAIASAEPDSETGREAALWVLDLDGQKYGTDCMKLLLAHHLENESMSEVCQSYLPTTADTEGFFRTLIEESPHDKVQGQACLALAEHLRELSGVCESIKDASAEARQQLGAYYTAELVELMADQDPDALMLEAEEYFEEAAATYGEFPWRGGQTVADAANATLFELRNLAIGMMAPEIEGADVDGVPFKLSEYRGKVIMLDFWGHW